MRTKPRFRRLKLADKDEFRCICLYLSATVAPMERFPFPAGAEVLDPGQPNAPRRALTQVLTVTSKNGEIFRAYLARRFPWGPIEFVFECTGDFSLMPHD